MIKNHGTKQLAIADILQPSCFDHEVGELYAHETHSAWVLCTGDYAYKIKKAVNFGFLDFSTLVKRKICCEKEIQLNSRFAPDLYLEIVGVHVNASGAKIGLPSGSDVVEYAVKMRQFNEKNGLLDIACREELNEMHIDQCVDVIANFHRSAEAYTSLENRFGSRTTIMHWMLENFDVIKTHLKQSRESEVDANVGTNIDTKDIESDITKLNTWVVNEAGQLADIFEDRKRFGSVRDCHGDLHLGNLTMVDGKVTPFDCIEFNEELRIIDVMSEIAFLVMDLAQRGLEDLARRFLLGYIQKTNDYKGLRVLPFYLVYRSMVRAKVSLLRRQQTQKSSPEYNTLTQEFLGYVHYAQTIIAPRQPSLMITLGFSGAGKSYYSQKLCEKLGYLLIRSDVLRNKASEESDLIDDECVERSVDGRARKGGKKDPGLNTDKYSLKNRYKVYESMFEMAEHALRSGYSIILDATFLDKEVRQQANSLATKVGVPFRILHFTADRSTLAARIEDRERNLDDASEASVKVLDYQMQSFEGLSEEESRCVTEVDTTVPNALEKLFQQFTKIK